MINNHKSFYGLISFNNNKHYQNSESNNIKNNLISSSPSLSDILNELNL